MESTEFAVVNLIFSNFMKKLIPGIATKTNLDVNIDKMEQSHSKNNDNDYIHYSSILSKYKINFVLDCDDNIMRVHIINNNLTEANESIKLCENNVSNQYGNKDIELHSEYKISHIGYDVYSDNNDIGIEFLIKFTDISILNSHSDFDFISERIQFIVQELENVKSTKPDINPRVTPVTPVEIPQTPNTGCEDGGADGGPEVPPVSGPDVPSVPVDQGVPSVPCDKDTFRNFIELCHTVHENLHTKFSDILPACDKNILPTKEEYDGEIIETVASYRIHFMDSDLFRLTFKYDKEDKNLIVMCLTNRSDKIKRSINNIITRFVAKLSDEFSPYESSFTDLSSVNSVSYYEIYPADLKETVGLAIEISMVSEIVFNASIKFLTEKIPQLLDYTRKLRKKIIFIDSKEENSVSYINNLCLDISHEIHNAFHIADSSAFPPCDKTITLSGDDESYRYTVELNSEYLSQLNFNFDIPSDPNDQCGISIWLWGNRHKVVQKNAMIVLDKFCPCGKEYLISVEGTRDFAFGYYKESTIGEFKAINQDKSNIAHSLISAVHQASEELKNLYNSKSYKNKNARIDESNDSLTTFCQLLLSNLNSIYPHYIGRNKDIIFGRAGKDGNRYCAIDISKQIEHREFAPGMSFTWGQGIFYFDIEIPEYTSVAQDKINTVIDNYGKEIEITTGSDEYGTLLCLELTHKITYDEFSNPPTQDMIDMCSTLINTSIKIYKDLFNVTIG